MFPRFLFATTTTATPAGDDPVRIMHKLVGARRYRDAVDHYRRVFESEQALQPEAALLAVAAATRIDALDFAALLAERALGKFTQRGDTDGRMRAVNMAGAVRFKGGRLDWAHVAFSLALRFAHQLKDTLFIARISNNLATVADLRGVPQSALTMYESALQAYQRMGDQRGLAETSHNLTHTYRQLARWDDAVRESDRAIRLADRLHEPGLLALAICGRAELHLERGDIDMAATSVERASRVLNGADDAISAGDVQRMRALIALRQCDFAGAREYAERARELAGRIGNALLFADASAASALSLRHLRLEGLADARYQRAIEEYTNMGATHFRNRFVRAWDVSAPRHGK